MFESISYSARCQLQGAFEKAGVKNMRICRRIDAAKLQLLTELHDVKKQDLQLNGKIHRGLAACGKCVQVGGRT